MHYKHLLAVGLLLCSQLSCASAGIVNKDSCTTTSDSFVCNRNDGELFLINLIIYVAIAFAVWKIIQVGAFYLRECGLPEEQRRKSRKSQNQPLLNPDDYVEMNHIKEPTPQPPVKETKPTPLPEPVKQQKPKKGYMRLNEDATYLDIDDERYVDQKKKKLREELSSKIKQLGLSPKKN